MSLSLIRCLSTLSSTLWSRKSLIWPLSTLNIKRGNIQIFLYPLQALYVFLSHLSVTLWCFLHVFRYNGPNMANMHIVADLYAEVIGVLAQAKWVDHTRTQRKQYTMHSLHKCLHINVLQNHGLLKNYHLPLNVVKFS